MNNDTRDNEFNGFVESNEFEEKNEIDDYYGAEERQEEVQETVPSGPSRRRRSKPRVKKKRRKKYYTVKFLIAVAVIVLLYFFAHSAVFTVENIQLEKNARFDLALVKKVTGLKTGVNLFEVDMGDCEEKLEARPYVEEAEVKRKLPDTITVSLQLREPASVVLFNKKYVMLDKNGNVLEIRKELPHYTFLEGLTVQDAKLGQPVKIKEEKKYEEYVSLLKKMNDADLYFRKMVIGDKNIKLYVKKNLYCVGTKKNIVAGMEDGNLKAVLWTLSKKGVKKGVVEVGDEQYYSFSKSVK